MRPQARPSALRGFTLLEVLVSVAILAISIVTLLIIRNNSVKETAKTKTAVTAAVLAREKMGEIESNDVNELTESGEFDGYPGYRWTKEVFLEEVSTDSGTTGGSGATQDPPKEIYKVVLTVAYPDDTEEKKLTVVSYRLKKEDEQPKAPAK